jgi:NAD(P)H dehydrogenase (quinone)
MVKALVLYHSQQHGNTEKMAEAVAEGLRSAECEVTVHNANEIRFPIEDYPQYDFVAIGTPDYYSYIAGTMKTFMDDWYMHRYEPGYMNKPHAVFYSHGGAGRVRASLSLFSRLGNQVGKSLESQGTPNEKVLKECRNLGVLLANSTHK